VLSGLRGPWDLDIGVRSPVRLDSMSGRANSLWRYEEALPLAGPAVSLGEGRTPLVPLTGHVSAKLDFLMPTRSFKDRGAVMLAELARRLSPERVVADSSGNAGTAVAAYCARAGCRARCTYLRGPPPRAERRGFTEIAGVLRVVQ
jgi:threonine synthase